MGYLLTGLLRIYAASFEADQIAPAFTGFRHDMTDRMQP